jgi:hypothetical protein
MGCGMSEPIIYDFEEIKAHLERIKVERELDEAALLDQANKPDVPVAAEEDKETFSFMIPINHWRMVGGSN